MNEVVRLHAYLTGFKQTLSVAPAGRGRFWQTATEKAKDMRISRLPS